MTCSVIIPTYNGAKKVITLIDSLENQTIKDFQIIVVIDGSTDNTVELLKSSKFESLDLKIIEQENMGRAAVRNRGALAASTELLIFFDDDMFLEKDCIAQHLEHHLVYKESILTGITRTNKFAYPDNDFYKYRYSIEETWQKPFAGESKPITFKNFSFTSGNLSLSKKLFEQLNGFDERLNDSEDLDFCIRALIKKTPVFVNHNILTWHCDYINIGNYIKRQKEYLTALAKLAVYHPEYLAYRPDGFSRAIKKETPWYLKLFIYNSIWERLLKSDFFLNLVSEKVRYKIYNMLIYSSSINRKK